MGRTLYSKKERQDEHSAFFEWLNGIIKENEIDVLLVVGDIFDTATPNTTSQKMYYNFLLNAKQNSCKNVIIVGGNHDSPSFLNAPKDILSALNVTVIGNSSENLEDEIVFINDINGNPALIVCAVPFLRERDISRFAEGETYSDRSKRINENIEKHYQEISKLALEKRNNIGKEVPIIATGHLSVAGGRRNDDDGVRDTYIGNIEAVGSDIFPEVFDYVALGHYHIPSVIKENIRYSGSPIPMGFGEAGQTKSVYIIECKKGLKVETINIPNFQILETIRGDKKLIEQRLENLKELNKSVWAEIIYDGNELFPDFVDWVNEQIEDSKIEVLKMQNCQYLNDSLSINDVNDSLNELDVNYIFDILLEKKLIQDEEKTEIKETYKEIVDILTIENEI